MTIALFRRLPTMWPPGSPSDAPLVDPGTGAAIPIADAVGRWPELAAELRDLDELLVPVYQECSQAAALEQNRHRRQQVLLIVGGLLTTTFGAVQAALAGAVWPGIVVAAVAATTTAVASVGRQSGSLDGYLANRLRAERLRSAYFAYLAGPPPADDGAARERRQSMHEQVVAIRYDEASST